MKKILCGALSLAFSSLSFSQVQLEKWFRSPDQLTFSTPYGGNNTNFNSATLPYSGTRGYNSLYEEGRLALFISIGQVYSYTNGVENLLGELDVYNGASLSERAGHEYGIIPHPDNYKYLCSSKKFYILYTLKSVTGPATNANGKVLIALVDLNGTNSTGPGSMTTGIQSVFKQGSDRRDAPMAIGPVKIPSYERFIYMQGKVTPSGTDDDGLLVYRQLGDGSFQFMDNDPTLIPDGKEMELSNAGDKLAFSTSNGITVVNLSPGTGMPTGSPYTFSVTSPNGLEFDETGNKLYYSANGGTGNDGVFVKDLLFPANTAATNITTSYGAGVLEKSYNNSYTTTEIICGDQSGIRGIDIATNTLNAWSNTSFDGLLMPDQIDGEYADISLFRASGAYRVCNGSYSGVNIWGAPMITPVTHSMSINGSPTGDFGNGTAPIGPVTSNTSIAFQIFYDQNPGCFITKSWMTHVGNCPVYPTIDVTPTIQNPGYYLLAADPADPSPVTGSAWYLSELSSQTNTPVFSINNPPCWQLSSTATNIFSGFFPDETNNYSGEISTLPCSGNDDGKFLYDRTYMITRETWIGKDPHQFYSVIVRNGIVIESTNTGAPKSMQINGETMEENAFSISPNPSTGIFTIALAEGTEKASIEIYNDLGALVKSSEQNTDKAEMDLSKLPKGIYMVKIISPGNLVTKKIVLE